MNNLIMTLIFLMIVIAVVIMLFIKTNGITLYHVFIYVSLIMIWTGMQIFARSSHNKIFTSVWLAPIMIALFQFTQVCVRLPLGILSKNIKSRKRVIQLVSTIYLLTATIAVAANMALWSVVLLIIGSGFVGATFGLNSQYWSENWNIKRVYWSVAIMFTVPVLSSLFGQLVNDIAIYAKRKLDLRWIILVGVIIEAIVLCLYSLLIKEKRKTIGLDLGVPAHHDLNYAGKKEMFFLILNISLACLIYTLFTSSKLTRELIGDGINHEIFLIKTLIYVFVAILVALFMVKRFNVFIITIIAITLMAIGTIIGGVVILMHQKNKDIWILALILMTIGFAMFQASVFGATLHFDHKYPALVLGIFLTCRSFALGTGQLTSDEIMVNMESNTGAIIVLTLTSIFVVSSAITIWLTHAKLRILYNKVHSYEFKLVEK